VGGPCAGGAARAAAGAWARGRAGRRGSFLEPLRRRLTATTGRPTIPIETHLRLAYLKHRHDLGRETLCKEVSDSFTWRRFCRIALDGRVLGSSTRKWQRRPPQLTVRAAAPTEAKAIEAGTIAREGIEIHPLR
jgi:hypothetical protein